MTCCRDGATRRAGGSGPLIAIEGIDGAGTTSHARMLAAWLTDNGYQVHRTCEPSTGPVGALLRDALRGKVALDRKTLALLFAADRLDHLEREISVQQLAGRWVITDRYVYSSLAYQSLDVDLAWVAAINAHAPDPDLVVFLRVDPLTAASRIAARGSAREIFDTHDQQARIAARYDEILAPPADPAGSRGIRPDPTGLARRPTVTTIDSSAPIDEVQQAVRNACREFALQRGIWDLD